MEFINHSYANLVQSKLPPTLGIPYTISIMQKVSSLLGRYLIHIILDYSFDVSILSGITIPAASRGDFLLFSSASASAFACASSGLNKVP